MKKMLLFIILSISFSSCQKKNSSTQGLEIAKGNMVALKHSLWNKGKIGKLVILKVLFLDGTEEQKQEVREIAPIWTMYANIKMEFYSEEEISLKNSHIRVTFKEGGNQSYIGKSRGRSGKWTLALSNLDKDIKSDRRGTILHEFGHAIGLRHEHQSPKRTFEFDRETLLEYCREVQGWDEKSCLNNYKKLDEKGNIVTDYDGTSIMHYALHGKIFGKDDLLRIPNNFLSLEDKIQIAKIYPGKEGVTEEIIKKEHEDQLRFVEETNEIGNCVVRTYVQDELLSKDGDEKVSFTHYQFSTKNRRIFSMNYLLPKRDVLYNMKNQDHCILTGDELKEKLERLAAERELKRTVGNCKIVPSEETQVTCPRAAFLIIDKNDESRILDNICYGSFEVAHEKALEIDYCQLNENELEQFYNKREEMSKRGRCEIKKSTTFFCTDKAPFGIFKNRFSRVRGTICHSNWDKAYEDMINSPHCIEE